MANVNLKSSTIPEDEDNFKAICRAKALLAQRENIIRQQEKILSKFHSFETPFFTCNVCGFYGQFLTFGQKKRPNAVCPVCHSFERTRYAIRVLDFNKKLTSSSSVLEIAPTKGTHDYFCYHIGCNYVGIDINPQLLLEKKISCRQFDLCLDDTSQLGDFDLILNIHVLEHVRCDPLFVIERLNKVLKPDGIHLISVPFAGKRTIENMSTALSPDERTVRFGHPDHQRAFGHDDFPKAMYEHFGTKFGEFDRSKFDNDNNFKFSLGLDIPANRLFYVRNR